MNKLPKHIVLEVTKSCNCDCLYCYNVWKSPQNNYPEGREITFPEIVQIFDGLINELPLVSVAISGGEPFLRADLHQIVSYLWSRHIQVVIITNGTLLSEENIARTCGATNYEIPLLSYREEIHNHLINRNEFRSLLQGMKNLNRADANFVATFVATKLNYMDLEKTVQLALAMGAKAIQYNRMNASAHNYKYLNQLFPTVNMIKENLETLNEMAKKYKFQIGISIPIQPCLIDISKYKHIQFGFCPLGDENSYFTIDPLGNLRVCNHSSTILGNLKDKSFKELYYHPYVQDFKTEMPNNCLSCLPEIRDRCHGGCKMAAQECYESMKENEPFVQLNPNKQLIPRQNG